MSISAISASSASDAQSILKLLQQEFQQLGTDLQSGNLSAAQSDLVTLQKDLPQGSSSTTESSDPLQQAFTQLAKDIGQRFRGRLGALIRICAKECIDVENFHDSTPSSTDPIGAGMPLCQSVDQPNGPM